MSAPQLRLDFNGKARSGNAAGVAVAVLGAAAIAAAFLQFRATAAQRAGLELRAEALARASDRQAEPARVQGLSSQETLKTVRALATPWSQLLAELEAASGDSSGSVAILAIEPDHAKHRIKVTAEARTLPMAIAYVHRLRNTRVLRYPMLDSHEVRQDDREHPVRFQLSAEWSDAS